jgi:hypothetical protein
MLSSCVVVAALGLLTHWRGELIAVYVIAFPASFVLFARLFYGLRASRTLDKEPIAPGSGWTGPARYDIDKPGYELEDACEKAQQGDVSDLKRLAEEEQSS